MSKIQANDTAYVPLQDLPAGLRATVVARADKSRIKTRRLCCYTYGQVIEEKYLATLLNQKDDERRS